MVVSSIMNHGNFNGFDDWNDDSTQFNDSDLSLVAEQEFVDYQSYLVGTTTNIAAAGSEIFRPEQEFVEYQSYLVGTTTSIAAAGSEIFRPDVTTEQILRLEETSGDLSFVAEQEFVDYQSHLLATTTNIAAACSEIFRPDGTTDHILQHRVISTQIANNNTMKETSGIVANASGVDPAKRERKRKCDREYRLRCKEKEKKTEEELEVLRKENALLHGCLQSANSKRMLELKPDGQQNDSDQLCKMEFRLDCYDDKLRGEAMKIVGEFPGLKCFNMDVEEKKLTLNTMDIDTIPLQHELRKTCNASLVSSSFVKKNDEETKDGRIVKDMVVARTSTLVAQNLMPCAMPYSSPFPHIDSTYPNGGSSEGVSEEEIISFTSFAFERCCGLF